MNRHTDYRHYLKRYGKFLAEEFYVSIKNGYERPYTLMRYVSQQEIDLMVNRFPHLKDKTWVHIPVCRENCYASWDGEIYEPGFYRVEQNKNILPFFTTVCANGFPLNVMGQKSGWMKDFNSWLDGRERDGRIERECRIARKKHLDERRKDFVKVKDTLTSRQFFASVAMAGAIATKQDRQWRNAPER